MRVLFVSSGNTKNGISPIVKNQGESLKKQGIDVDYFTINGKGILGYLNSVRILKNLLKSNSYQIIHAHYGLCGIVSHLARKNEKLIVSFMGDDLIGTINKKNKYSYYGHILVFQNKLFIPYYDYVIVKSKRLSEKIKTSKLDIIPNGVDLNIFFPVDKNFARKELKLSNDKKILLFVSNPKRPEKNYVLVQNSVSLLKRNDILLIPVYNVTQEQLNYYYNAADSLLLSSLHEGSPNVIKEAMVCCCPIVSTDVGDVRWILGNTEGCFISSFDPEDFAKNINMALEFSEKYKKTNGRNRIIELGLDSQTIAKRIINVYQKVISPL